MLNLKHFPQMQRSRFLQAPWLSVSTHLVGRCLKVEPLLFFEGTASGQAALHIRLRYFFRHRFKGCLDGSQRKTWTARKSYPWIAWFAVPEKGRGGVLVWGKRSKALQLLALHWKLMLVALHAHYCCKRRNIRWGRGWVYSIGVKERPKRTWV